MGQGLDVKCPSCGYKFGALLGEGKTTGYYAKKIQEEMKAGKYGEEGKRFISKACDDDILDCQKIVFECKTCKDLSSDAAMAIKGEAFPRKCSRCETLLKPWFSFESDLYMGSAKCPKCGGTLEDDYDGIYSCTCWD